MFSGLWWGRGHLGPVLWHGGRTGWTLDINKEVRSSEGPVRVTSGGRSTAWSQCCLRAPVGAGRSLQRQSGRCLLENRTNIVNSCVSPFQNVSDSARMLICFSLKNNYAMCDFLGEKNPLDLKTQTRMMGGKTFRGSCALVIGSVS